MSSSMSLVLREEIFFSGAEFSFLSINQNLVEAEENTTVTLPFNISTINLPGKCSLNGSFLIMVRRTCNGNKHICSIFHDENGTCQNPKRPQSCRCCSPAEEGTYVFNRTVTREDNCTWIWMEPGGMIKQKEITFIVKYPPEVAELNLSQVLNTGEESLSSMNASVILTVEESSTVYVVCTWDPGNPKADAILSHSHMEIKGNTTRSIGEIRYRFAAVGCQDAGLIRCQAPGATRNQSATLLIRCPPQIQALSETTLTLKENMQLNTSVRAHVNTITKCTLTRADSNKTINCTRYDVYGSLPDLTVSVWLDNVAEQDKGTWSLTLTNEKGDGQINFSLTLTVDDTNTSPSPTTSTTSKTGVNNGNQPTIVISVFLTFLTVAAVVSITMYLLCRQKRARKADEAYKGSKKYVMLRQDHYRESNDLSSPSSNTMTNGGSGILPDVVLPLNATDEGDNSAIRFLDSPYWEVADRLQRSTQQPGGGATHRTVESDYAEIGAEEKLTGRHQQQPPCPPPPQQNHQQQRQLQGDSGLHTSASTSDPLYVDAAEVRKRKAEKRRLHLQDEEDPMYVDAAEVRRRKAEAKGAASRAAAAVGQSADETHTYVDITDIQRRKRLARQKKESGENENLTEGASFNLCGTDNDWIDRREEDASVRTPTTTTTTRTTSHYAEIQFDTAPSSNRIIGILPQTDYAQIQFNTPPPRPPERGTSEQTASK